MSGPSALQNKMETFFSSNELEIIRKNLSEPSIQIFLNTRFGANHSDHREKIKKELKKTKHSTSSISHCEKIGGFATLDNSQKKIGFDVEEFSRVTDQIMKRMTKTHDEFNKAPSADFLWAAKESAFKALYGPSHPKVISEIEIGGWSQSEEDFWIFSAANFENLKGIAVRKGPLITALCIKY